MNTFNVVAIALIAAGVLGLVYGGFTYTKESHEANLGPLELSIKEKESVSFPVWAGVACVAAGATILLAPLVRHPRG